MSVLTIPKDKYRTNFVNSAVFARRTFWPLHRKCDCFLIRYKSSKLGLSLHENALCVSLFGLFFVRLQVSFPLLSIAMPLQTMFMSLELDGSSSRLA